MKQRRYGAGHYGIWRERLNCDSPAVSEQPKYNRRLYLQLCNARSYYNVPYIFHTMGLHIGTHILMAWKCEAQHDKSLTKMTTSLISPYAQLRRGKAGMILRTMKCLLWILIMEWTMMQLQHHHTCVYSLRKTRREDILHCHALGLLPLSLTKLIIILISEQ